MDELTTDAFFNGRILVKQSRSGYRFSIDAVLLAGFARPEKGNIIMDLGTGCGIIPLILASRNPFVTIYGVEIQKGLADIADMNVKKNRMEDSIKILCMDMKLLKPDMIPHPVQLVISNPPYRKAESGRINPNQERAIARHEIAATLFDVVDTARRMLPIAGRFLTLYPAERMTDVLSVMQSAGIEPKFFRSVHSIQNSNAKLILVEGIRGGRSGIKIGPPLIIYSEDVSYTDEVQQMFMP